MKKAIIVVAVLVGIAVLLGIFLPWPFLLMWGFVHFDGEQHLAQIETLGQYGDAYGVLTSLFTLFAMVLLYRTYHFQTKEVPRMLKFMERQTAWTVILQLCEQYRDMVAQTRAIPQGGWMIQTPQEIKGKEGLMELIAHALEWSKSLVQPPIGVKEITPCAEIAFNSYEGCFRLLHRIFKFIDQLEVLDEKKQEYARFPRAMLSNIELEAILINCLTTRGEGMKIYVEKYRILNNYIPVALDGDLAREFCNEYSHTAFGDDNLFLRSG